MVFFFGVEYVSIDAYITQQFVNNRTSFILFYMQYKPLFSSKFQRIFNRYLIHYLCGNFVCFDGMRHLIKVLHNRILLKNVSDGETCKPLRPIYDVSLSELETKYRCKEDMKNGLKAKIKDTIYYKFSSNSTLYKIDNIIKQKYDIHSSDLLGFVLNVFVSQKKLTKFINHFLKTLIHSHLYRNTDKLQLFILLFTLPSTKYVDNYKIFYLIQEGVINSKYVIPQNNKTSSGTLFYNLLSSNDDTHCHDFYNFVCCEYNQNVNREKTNYQIYSSDTDTTYKGSISNYEHKFNKLNTYNNIQLSTPFKIIFDVWLNSVISYEISKITNVANPNMHTFKFLKSLYYLLIYMLHHTKSKKIKHSLFSYIKKLNTVYLSTNIVSIELLEERLEKYSLTILDTLQAEECRKLLKKYKKQIHIINNIFIKLAFRYSLEYYASNLIKRMEDTNTSNVSQKYCLESLISDIKEFIRIVCYYKETSNIKLYKQFNKTCIEKILLSENYKRKYYNIGIYLQNMKEDKVEIDAFALTKTDEFLNPHFVADYLKFIHFCYPKIKMNKQMYILLVDFFIFTVKETDIWTVRELDNIWDRLIFLIYKYSNTRKNITFPEKEKNIYFIHCILKRLHHMNIDMTNILNVLNKQRLTSDESVKQYIDSMNYIQNKKYLLRILLRKLKHPKLRDLFYENAVADKFVNTLNETLFQYTPNVLKKYFNSYYGKVRKYINYIANDTELYEILNSIYDCVFKRDMEKRYIIHIKNRNIYENENENEFQNSKLELKINMKEESLFRNILEEPVFLNFENISYLNDFKYKTLKYGILSSLDDYIKQLEFQKVEQISKQQIIFTDEFLDPIMKTEIKEPILLPKCNNIMDKSVLEEMLLYNTINPFTQEELYMEDVLKYNEEETSKIHIQNFLKRKKEFIKEYGNNTF
jgi:hypothetical protein